MSRPRDEQRTRYRTGDADVDARLVALLDAAGATDDRDQLFEILVSAVRLAGDDADRLDLKITNAALKEMRAAFRAFAPYRDRRKATIFGSARTVVEHPTYLQAHDLAAQLAAAGWMVVTGAGPGIMSAGLDGAGRENSFGVNIRLPFEQAPNPFIAGDPKLISMKYFFTRKLMLMKESHGFVSLPGGFGTLDETFELLTLVQTGKATPAPIVLLDQPGGDYWSGLDRYLRGEVLAGGYIGEADFSLYTITDEVTVAVDELLSFVRNFHSLRWVEDLAVIRLRHGPTVEEVEALNDEFTDLLASGRIESADAHAVEVAAADHVDLPRVALRAHLHEAGRLRALLDRLNRLGSLPPA